MTQFAFFDYNNYPFYPTAPNRLLLILENPVIHKQLPRENILASLPTASAHISDLPLLSTSDCFGVQ